MDRTLTPLAFAPAAPEPAREPRFAPAPAAGATTHIWLLRHGAVASGLGSYGNSDVPLSAEGEAQTAHVAEAVARHVRPARVLSSPLCRALAMGEAIAAACPAAELLIDPRLAELWRGDWQGIDPDEYLARWRADADAYWRDPLGWRGHGGETEGELAARAAAAIEERIVPGGTLVVTAHRQVIRAFVAAALGIPPGRSHALGIPTGTGLLLSVDARGAYGLERTAVRTPGAPQAAEPADGPPGDVPTSLEALEDDHPIKR